MLSYGEEMADQFHGRSRQVEDMLSIFHLSRFIGLAGPECSGKTSLVMAGLVPVLRRGFRGLGGETWRVCQCIPGITPIENLSFALAMAEATEGKASLELQQEFTILIRTDHSGLHRSVNKIGMLPGENLLIIIDRLEELFELSEKYLPGTSGAVEADLLMGNIVRMLSVPGLPVYVMFVIKSDFIPSLYNFRNLHGFLSSGLYALPLFRQDDFNEIVSRSLASAHIRPTSASVDQIRMHFGQDLRNLPVLQLYLQKIIERFGPEATPEKPFSLDVSDLELVEPMDTMISRKLDAAYASMDPGQQHVMHQLFSHIVQPGEGSAMKKPQTVREIVDRRALEKTGLSSFLKQFNRDFPGILSLVTPYDHQLTHFMEQEIPDSGVVTLSSTHTIRNWHQLSEWVALEREAETLYRRLSDAARLHALGQSGFLRPPDLDVFMQWWDSFKPQASWAAQFNTQYQPTEAYLRESHAKHIEETERKERERREELKKARKRVLIGIIVAIVSVMLAAWAMNESNEATKANKKAKASEDVAKIALSDAKKNYIKAYDATERALKDQKIAQRARDSALIAKRIADSTSRVAVSNLKRAEKAEDDAKEKADQANKSAREAAQQRDKARDLADREKELKEIAAQKAAYESAGKKILALYNKATTGRFESPAERIEFIRDVSEAYQAYDSSSRLVNQGRVLPDRYLFDILSEANRQISRELKGKSNVRTELAATAKDAGLRDIATWRGERIAAAGDQLSPLWYDRADGKVRTVKVQGNDTRLRAVTFAGRDTLLFVNVRGDLFMADLRRETSRLLAKLPQPATSVGGLTMAGSEVLMILDGKLLALRLGGGPVHRRLDVPAASLLFETEKGIGVVTERGLYFSNAGAIDFKPLAVNGLLSDVSAAALQGDRLFIGNEVGQIMIYRRTGPGQPFTQEWKSHMPAHRTRVTALRFDAATSRLFTASLDKTSNIYDLTLGDFASIKEHHVKLQGFEKWIWDFELIPGKPQSILYSVDEKGKLTSWVTQAAEMHAQIEQYLKTTGNR
jgi:hypothetical protein